MRRISDTDLNFRHSALYAMCVALGYIDTTGSKTSAMEFYKRVDAARQRGDVVIPQDGHYTLTRDAYQRVVDTFTAQRTRAAA